jgi:pilus assembly protein FimV
MSFHGKIRQTSSRAWLAAANTRGLGKTMKRWLQISGLAAALVVMSGLAQAAGLGRLSVQSVLGQPLRAEIDLLSVTADELGMVEAKLASPEAFRQARIERTEALAGLRFSVDRRANGQPIVRITSVQPINDPFVDLLIELNWSAGRILREYTLLLDPTPEPMAQAEAILERVAPVAAPSMAEPPPKPAPAARPPAPPVPAEADKPKPRPTAEPSAEEQPRKSYGPVKVGETLHSIAAKLAPPEVSLEMMMAGLYAANRQAFLHDNMNLLKKGRVLDVPEGDAVMRMTSPQQARMLIGEHAAAWHARQARVAEQAARAEETPAPPPSSAASGRIVQAQPQAPVPAPGGGKDVLKLSKGEPAAKEGAAAKRIESLETELAVRSRALEESQSRVNQLEKTVKDLQRLIELKAKEVAKPAAVQPAAAKEEVKKAEKKPAEVAKPEAAKPEAKEPAKPAPKAATLPVKEEPGLLGMLLDNPLYIGGVVAAVILGILLWVVMVGNRRRKGLSDFEQSIMSGGDQFKTSIFRTGAGAGTRSGTTTQSGIATDFSRLGLGSIDTHEVDPIAEAEVYMAYGRDAQAEEILKEALTKDPARHEIALKLLEIYAARQDTATFETQASELYAALGGENNPLWHKAAEMGRRIDPDNPLYRVYGSIPALPETPPSAAQATDTVPAPAPAEVPPARALFQTPSRPEPEPQLLADAEEQVIEFDLQEPIDVGLTEETPAPVPAGEPEAASEVTMDFDLSEFAAEDAGRATAAAGNAPGSRMAEAGASLAMPGVEAIHLSEAESMSPELPATEDAVLQPMPGTLAELEAALPGARPAPADAVQGSGQVEGQITLPDLDFSGINLDLSDTDLAAEENEPTQIAESEVTAPAASDADLADEVNIKLDLAKAYLEMGDKEGAGEILSEVLKEGDGRQQEEARKLMADLA